MLIPPPPPSASPQAKGEEALSNAAQPEDGPGSDGGGGPEHRHGLRGEAAGGAALLRVRQAVLHQRARARRAHDLLTPVAIVVRLMATDVVLSFAVVVVVVTSMHARVYSRVFDSALLE